MNYLVRLFWSQILVFAIAAPVSAGPTLFKDDSVLDVELRGPVGKTIRDKREPLEREFVIVVDGVETPVMVRTRGNSRLQLCSFPPLRLNFSSTGVQDERFAGLDKVKLVSHCADKRGDNDNLLEEYAAYRILNLLTDRSHRVRLLRVRYVDIDKPKRDPLVKYAFVLEPLEDLAARTGSEVAAIEHVAVRKVERKQAALVFVFEYFLANIDWSLVTATGEKECCHNVRLLAADEKHYLVPYDFDMSGFVYPLYARRAPAAAGRSVRRRQYQGYCFDGLDLDAAIRAMVARQGEIMALVDTLDWSEEKEVRKRREFLQDFFTEAAEGGLEERMERSCIG